MRQECFNGTFREHVYILSRNVHTEHSENVSCIFLMKTFKIYSLRTSQTHTMRIKKDISIKKTGPEAGQYFHVRPPIGFI